MAGLFSTHEVASTLRSLSKKQRRVLLALGVVFVACLVGILWQIDKLASDLVATSGGQLTEGIIGTPRFINPLLASSDADRDLTALIYSGLMRVDTDGSLIPDLAKSYSISDDGLTYTFVLREDLKWHDGKPVTTEDVEFTILKAQDPSLKSPKRGSWDGVKIEKQSPVLISLRLKQAYPQFLENATMGIIPKHIWSKLDTDTFALNQFNIEPIGTGPYKIKTINKNDLGIANYYDLVPFRQFVLGQAKIDLLRLRFFRNENELVEAYKNGGIDSLSAISAQNAKTLERDGARILRSPLPRVFAVFFNQNKAPVLANKEVRQALDLAIDRQAIINNVLKGYGLPATGPLPQMFIAQSATDTEALATSTSGIAAAKKLLEAKGWTWDEAQKLWQKKSKKETVSLTLSIATSDIPELRSSAELLKATWEKLGVPVNLKIYEIGDLDLNVIRPRQYEALFFGEILGRTPDLFSFWHSGQRLDPGLNIAQYTNLSVDKLLGETRTMADKTELREHYEKVGELIKTDVPAVFVYSPDFLYSVPPSVNNVILPPINTPSDRFLSIYKWYISTDRVWKIFINQENRTH